MRTIAWLYLFTSLPALAGQVALSVLLKELDVRRALFLAVGLGLSVFALALRKTGRANPWFGAAAAASGAGLFWITALEYYLAFHLLLLAKGLLLFLSAAVLHATLLFAGARPRGTESETKRWMLRAALLLTASSWMFFTLESFFRIFVPLMIYEVVPDDPREGPLLTFEERTGRFLSRPNFKGKYMHPEFTGVAVATNAYGFRDGLDEATPPRPEELSILVLGDSLAFGTGVNLEETFHERLESWAAAAIGRPLRVYCGALPGYCPYSSLIMLEECKEQTRPDWVVLAIYEGNDFEDNLTCLEWAKKPPPPPAASPSPVRARKPELVRFLQGVAGFTYWNGTSAAAQVFFRRFESVFVHLGLINPFIPTNRFLNELLLDPEAPRVKEGVDTLVALLDKLRARCKTLHAELLVLLIPAAVQAEPGTFEELRSVLPPEAAKRIDRTAFHLGFLQRLLEKGFTVIDMLPHLEKAGQEGKPCYYREGHWNVEGHRLAAEQLILRFEEIFAEQLTTAAPEQ